MELLTTPKEIESAFSKLLKKYERVSFAVAWASQGFPGYALLLAHRKKILKGVVGIHFYQTDPAFIETFLDDKRVSFVKQPDGVFHPKFYLFENSRTEWECLLGSANFTRGGFGTNIEVCIVFGTRDSNPATIKTRLNRQLLHFFRMGKQFKPEELEYYKSLHARYRERMNPIAGHFGDKTRARSVLITPILQMSWDAFFNNVRKDKYHGLDERISVLSAARHRFEKYEQFNLMPREDRQGVAGFGGSKQVPWGWFGSMFGAGTFKNRVNENDINLSHALDAIPPTGEVLKEHYSEFVDAYTKAFAAGTGHGLGTATRLLAMKRPDYFVCFDSANRRGLCKAFDITLGHHDYARYWTSVIERILQSNWWNSPRPKTLKKMKVWDGRAAFLDSLYYVPKNA